MLYCLLIPHIDVFVLIILLKQFYLPVLTISCLFLIFPHFLVTEPREPDSSL